MANKLFSFWSKDEKMPDSLKQITSLLQSLPQAVCLLDGKGVIVFANERISAVSGFKPASLAGTPISKYGLPFADVQALLADGAPAKLIKEMVTKDIESVYMSVGASRLEGTPYILLTFDEVPEYRKLVAEKQFFKSVVEHYPFALTVQDRRGACLVWNAQAEKLFGVAAASAVGRKVRDLVPAELAGALDVLDKEVKDRMQSRMGQQMSFKDASGKETVLCVTKVPTPDANGEIASILTVFEDITSRHMQEEDLLQTRNLLQAILDNVPLGVYTRTLGGEMTYYNKQSQVVFAETEPKCVNAPHPKQDLSTVMQYAERERRIIEGGKLQEYPDEIYVDRNGNEKIIHMIKVPLQHAGPEPLVLSIVEDVTKKREQEREIITANGFLSAIVDNAPIGLYARTKTGKMLLRNKMCEAIFGSEGSRFDEQGSLPHETQDQVSGYLNREAQLLESGKPLDITEEAYTTEDGTRRLLHMVKVPVPDADGNGGFVITMVEDITERKEQERKLVESKNFQQAILDNAPLAIYARGVDQVMSFVNKKALEMFPGESLYKEENNFYGDRERAMFLSGKIIDVPEEEYKTKTGGSVLLHLIKAPVFDKEGKPFMVLSIAEDITQKKQQEKEVHETKNFLQNVVDNLPIALSVKKPSGEYILWNKRSEDLFGVSAKDVIGKNSYRTDITAEQAEFVLESDKKVFESRRELNIAQELISTPTEGVKIMHTVKTPLYKAGGEPDYLLNVSEDITAKTKMEKQIREAGEKNSLLVENAREGILILEDYKVIYANRAACRILGYEAAEEIMRKPLAEFVSPDHQIFAKDKYESVINGLEGASEPAQLHFVKKSGARSEVELTAMASKYLGRRIVIAFLRDVTGVNKNLREVRGERETFKNVFERGLLPAFILNHKGYINVMNKAARELFQLTENDRNFYRNVYIRPALTPDVRRKVRRGESARMEYVFDFGRAAAKFPGRVRGEGVLPLLATLEPFNRRNAKDGSVEADYLVTLKRKDCKGDGPAVPPAAPLPLRTQPVPGTLVPPAPPAAVWLPNTEPYVVCSPKFKIVSCNDLFCTLCQLGREELKGQEILKLFSQDSLERAAADLKKLPAAGGFENRDYRIHLASGLETAPVRVSAQTAANGNYVFIFRNMAYQQQMMQILQERSAQLNALLEVTDGSVFSVYFEDGRFGRVEQANKFLSRLVGYTHDELTSMQFARLFTAPDGKNEAEVKEMFDRAARLLEEKGRASFGADLYAKDGRKMETSVTLTSLDIPGKNAVLALVTDLSDMMQRLARDSKEALELRSMRRSLPGLYLKMDREGRVLEVSSNLPYLSDEAAREAFLGKLPAQYWPWDAAEKELFSIKEASSVNINTTFEFEWEVQGKRRFFEAVCTPISGREEVVLWVKDVTDRRIHEKHIRELYAISNENKGTITEQVDKILDFGKKVFRADVGIVMRFNGNNPNELTVVYATQSPFNIERYMVFPVEECLFDVRDDNVVVFPDLANTDCKRCIHKEKHFGSLIAAPLYVGGKVAGALCFAASAARGRFEEGAEELIGIMSRILSLRIELREASKTLGETSQSFMRTLEYVDLPAVVLDLKYRVRYANDVFLSATGRRRQTVENREFFDEFIRSAENSRRTFESAEKNASGNAFQIKLDLVDEHGKYYAAGWDVFLMKDIKGDVEGYGLIGVRSK